MSSIDRRGVMHGIAGVGAFLVAGCGRSGSNSAPTPTPTGSAPTPTPSPTPTPPPRTYGEVPSRPVYTEQTAFRPSSPYPIGVTIDWYVDALNGSDGNSGSQSTPFQTLDRARQLASPDQVIGLRRGQTHFRPFSSTLPDIVEQSVVGYGSSVLPATLSGGQMLSGKTFTAQGNGVYKTTLQLPVRHTPGGAGQSGTNTTYPFVRIDEDYFEYITGGASVSANLDRLASASGPAFCIFGTGSSVADMRNEPAGLTNFDLFVRLSGGANPNGQPIIAMSHPNIYIWGCELLQDIALRDAWSKDTSGTAPASVRVPLLRRVESIGGGSHGFVGSCNVDGFRATGVARPGMGGFEEGRAAGGGLNLFSRLDRRGQSFQIRGLDLQNFNNAFYGHTSSSADFFARQLVVESTSQEGFTDFRVRNCSTSIKTDPSRGEPSLIDGIAIRCEIDHVDIDRFLNTESVVIVEAGGTVIFKDSSAPGHSISALVTSASQHTVRGVTFYSPKTNSFSFGLDLCQATGSAVGAASLRIENCELPTNPDYSFRIGRRSEAEGLANVTLSGSTVTGDVIDPTRGRLPQSFTARDSAVFGFADRASRQEVRDLLVAQGVGGTIADTTTLIRLDGTIAERPA